MTDVLTARIQDAARQQQVQSESALGRRTLRLTGKDTPLHRRLTIFGIVKSVGQAGAFGLGVPGVILALTVFRDYEPFLEIFWVTIIAFVLISFVGGAEKGRVSLLIENQGKLNWDAAKASNAQSEAVTE